MSLVQPLAAARPLDGAHLQERAVSSVHSSVHGKHTHWYLSLDLLFGVHQGVALPYRLPFLTPDRERRTHPRFTSWACLFS